MVVAMELSREELARAQRGDLAARARLVAVYHSRVFAVCRALARDDGADCAHDTFVKVLSQLERFDDTARAPFGAFILRVARNICIDRARRANVRRPIDLDVDAIARPDRSSLDPERVEQVRAAVLALPDDQRIAVALRMWGDLEYHQIAEIEGVPIGTIRSRLSRARDALRAALANMELAHVG